MLVFSRVDICLALCLPSVASVLPFVYKMHNFGGPSVLEEARGIICKEDEFTFEINSAKTLYFIVCALWRKKIHALNCVRVIQQDRQCTYNVTLRRVHETIFAVEKQ